MAIKGHDDRLKVANSAAVEGGQKHSREAGNPIDSDLNVAHWDGFEFCRIYHIRLTLNFVRKNFYHLIWKGTMKQYIGIALNFVEFTTLGKFEFCPKEILS